MTLILLLLIKCFFKNYCIIKNIYPIRFLQIFFPKKMCMQGKSVTSLII